MISQVQIHTLQIEPRGPVLPRIARHPLPAGHQAFSSNWSVALPLDLRKRGVTITEQGFEHADDGNPPFSPTSLAFALTRFWNESLRGLIPDPHYSPPVSAAGLIPPALVSRPLLDEGARAGMSEDYLDASIRAEPPEGIAAGVWMVFRCLSVLSVPYPSLVRLRISADEGWHLDFRERGAVGLLLDRLVAHPARAKDTKGMRYALQAASVESDDLPAPQVLALARALQLAAIIAACHLRPPGRVEITVSCSDLQGMAIRLRLDPGDWGLGLGRLAKAMRDALVDTAALPSAAALCAMGPSVDRVPVPVHSLAASEAGARITPYVPGQAVRWIGAAPDQGLRFVYAGTTALPGEPAGRLPFAVAPPSGALWSDRRRTTAFADLDGTQQEAYRAWLRGPRRGYGFTEPFGLLYLQGLEYRLLADQAAVGERTDLVAEIQALKGLCAAGSVLGTGCAALLDWLGATGIRPRLDLSQETPLTSLVLISARVAHSGDLDAEALYRLALLLSEKPDIPSRDDFSGSFCDLWPEGLRLRPPRVRLSAGYQSLSGCCDIAPRPLEHNGSPAADFRMSGRARWAIMGIATIARRAAPRHGRVGEPRSNSESLGASDH